MPMAIPNVLAIFGTRPQFLKVAALWRAAQHREDLRLRFVDSGQHYSNNLSDVFRNQLDFPRVEHVLNVLNQRPADLMSRVVADVASILRQDRPTAVMVFGDTNTTLAAAVAGSVEQIPVIHVESGLRSGDPTMPEEANRRGTDHLSRWLLTPTAKAAQQLRAEGIEKNRIHHVGDLTLDLFDALYQPNPAPLTGKKKVVVTLHRQANVDDPVRLAGFVDALEKLAQHLSIFFFVHPRTRLRMSELGLEKKLSQVNLSEPIGYLEMLQQIGRCHLVVTDSGGLQKDAVFAGRPCVVYRGITEWEELVGHGVWLTDTAGDLVETCLQRIATPVKFDRSLYGGGLAGRRICDFVAGLSG